MNCTNIDWFSLTKTSDFRGDAARRESEPRTVIGMSRRRLAQLLAVIVLAIVFDLAIRIRPAQAANIWDGGGVNDDWATADNWDDDSVPINNGSADVTFGTGFGSGTSINTGLDRDINSLTINTSTVFSIDNNKITLQSGNFTRTGSGNKDINSNVELAASGTWNVSASGETRFNGTISESGGAQSITYNGGGRLWLQGPGTYSGGVTLNSGGLLWITNNTALGTGKFTWNSGRILGDATLANDIAFGSGSHSFDNTKTFNGTIDDLTQNLSITGNNGSLTLAGDIGESGGPFSINMSGGGALVLNGELSITGGIVKSGGGEIHLSGANASLAGDITHNAGRFRFGQNNVLGSGKLIINGGQIGGVLVLTSQDNDVEINGNFGYFTGGATLTGPVTLKSSTTISRNNNADQINLLGDISEDGGSFGITTVGGSTTGLTLGGTNTYTGTTTVSVGRLVLDGSLATGDVVIAGGATMQGTGTINFNLGDVIDVNGTLNANALQFDLTALPFGSDDLVLVDYSSGTFNGPGNINDLLNPASQTLLWSLTDTGTQILASNPIPEPSTLLLLTLGMFVMVRRRRERKK